MKKHIIVFLLYISCVIHASCPVDSISKILEQSIRNHDIETYIRFFPTQRSTFVALFGFYENGFSFNNTNMIGQDDAYAPLYECDNCIPFLFDTICRNDSLWDKYEWYLTPLLTGLAVSIKTWEADQVNFLQDGIIGLLLSRDGIWHYIEKLYVCEKTDFWHFIFDAPVSSPELYQKIVQRAAETNASPKTVHIITKTYKQLRKKQWDYRHG